MTHTQTEIDLVQAILPEQSIIFLFWTLQKLELWKKINQIQRIKISLFNNTWNCFNQTFKKESGRDQLKGTELNRNG